MSKPNLKLVPKILNQCTRNVGETITLREYYGDGPAVNGDVLRVIGFTTANEVVYEAFTHDGVRFEVGEPVTTVCYWATRDGDREYMIWPNETGEVDPWGEGGTEDA